MKRLFQCAALVVLALFALGACGPSAAEQERRAAAAERDKLHEERKEMKEKRKLDEQTRVEGECAASYNTCVARCDTLLYVSARAACMTDCGVTRDQCLQTK